MVKWFRLPKTFKLLISKARSPSGFFFNRQVTKST
nr:MAG TPA: hypothetical protein [Caudoviricetes sp.]